MAYTVPRLVVYQEFNPILAGGAVPLNACIVAPHYKLHRFSETSERVSLGEYDSTTDQTYAYIGKTAGSVVDQAYNKLYMKDAVLQYYNMTTSGIGTTVNGGNRVCPSTELAPIIFKKANGYNRSAAFGTRDVKVGDYVKVTYTAGGSHTVETIVSGLVADVVDSTIGSYDNTLAAATVGTAIQTALPTADTTPIDADLDADAAGAAAAYKSAGIIDGVMVEGYTVTVTTAGAPGVAVLSVVSDSGTDDVAAITTAAFGANTLIGTRGAFIKFDNGGVGTPVFAEGNQWKLTVSPLHTKPAPASNVNPTNYSGRQNTKYIVRILRGGIVGTDNITYDVYTSTGYDSMPSQTVTAAELASVSSVLKPVGSYGVTIKFVKSPTAEEYVSGDQFTVDVEAAGEAAVRTLVLGAKLPSATTTTNLTITLGLKDTFELESINWTASASAITVFSTGTHNGTYLGSAQTFPILSGELFINYRELLKTYSTSIHGFNNITDALVLGPKVVDNPLALLVDKAIQNSNGTMVYFISLETDDLAGYTTALEPLSLSEEVYSLVTWSTATAVKDLYEAHIINQSSPEFDLWRIGWMGNDVPWTTGVYTLTTGGDIIEATVSGTSNNYRTVNSDNALFLTGHVEAGMLFRIGYTTDVYGAETYGEFVIDSVDSENQLTLLDSLPSAIGVPVRCEIWKTSTNSEYAQAVATESARLKNRRVRSMWCDDLYDALNPSLPMSALAAALAGLRSGVAPHQPLTRVEIGGIEIRNTHNFGSVDLDVMAAAGTWIAVKNLAGSIYTRHQLTTDMTDINMREDTVTTNLDSISRDLRTNMDDLYGRGNVSPQMLKLIRSRIASVTSWITMRPYAESIGPQILDLVISSLNIDPVLRDHVEVVIEPTLPYPLNNLTLRIRIS